MPALHLFSLMAPTSTPISSTADASQPQRRTLLQYVRRSKLATAATLLTAIGFVAAGTLSTFTASGVRNQTVSSGSFAFTLGDPATGPFSVAISGMAPGDLADRTVTLTNPAGGLNYGQVALSATATTSSLLNTDAVNGLTLKVDDCSVAWTQATSTSAATCSGTTTPLTAATPLSTIITSGATYTAGLAALTTGGVDYLRFHYNLPTASTGTAGLTSTVQYTFTATQATGGAYH